MFHIQLTYENISSGDLQYRVYITFHIYLLIKLNKKHLQSNLYILLTCPTTDVSTTSLFTCLPSFVFFTLTFNNTPAVCLLSPKIFFTNGLWG